MCEDLAAVGRHSRVRLAREEDVEALAAAADLEDYWLLAGFESAEGYRRLIRVAVGNQTRFGGRSASWLWCVEPRGGGRPCGMAYFARSTETGGDGLGGIFDPERRRGPMAAEALCLTTDMVFGRLGFRRIAATVRPDNRDAYRFWTGLGYRAEGTRPATGANETGMDRIICLGLWEDDFRESLLVQRILRRAGADG